MNQFIQFVYPPDANYMPIRVTKYGPGGPAGLKVQALAERPGSKFRPGRAFCGARTKSAGLMLGSGAVIIMYYVLAAGLRAVLERCLLGLMLGLPDIVWCRPGLGLAFR